MRRPIMQIDSLTVAQAGVADVPWMDIYIYIYMNDSRRNGQINLFGHHKKKKNPPKEKRAL